MGDFKKGAYILQIEAKDIVKNEYTYKVKKDNKRMYNGNLPYSLMYIKLKSMENDKLKLFETISNKEYLNAFVSVKFNYKIDTTIDDEDFISVKDRLKNIKKEIKDISNDENVKEYKKLCYKFNTRQKKIYELEDEKKAQKIKNELETLNDKMQLLENTHDVVRNFVALRNEKNDLLADKQDILENNLILSKDDLRESLYRDGFKINSIKYVRCYRTAGNARIGTCIFCRSDIYQEIKNYMYLGMELDNKSVNLANLESYICLPCSSIIGTFRLKPSNILLIDDIESEFETKTKSVETIGEGENKHIIVAKDESGNDKVVKITNNVTDGECILDNSIFTENGYERKSVLQLRQRMYKGIGVRCDIQKFFSDNGIKSISQLNGKTLATDIKDIKMITTPSSLKYLKFGKFEDWCNSIDDMWGIASYDKGTKYFKDNLVQTHYQLLNTLPMSREDMESFLQETLEYINGLKNNYRLLKYHIKARTLEEMIGDDMSDIEKFIAMDDNLTTPNDVMNAIMKVNDDIRFTKLFKSFKKEMIKSYVGNVRLGHVLVRGNYSVLVTDIYEMLLHSIGKYDEDKCLLKPNEIICTKFAKGSKVVGSRSPHISTSSVGLLNNCDNEETLEIYKRYFKLNGTVCFISGIKNNIMQQLSGFDVDGDKLLLTDNEHILRCAEKIDSDFYIPPSDCIENDNSPIKINNIENKIDIDKKSAKSTMEIGIIINTSQLLNSLLSHIKINKINYKQKIEKYIDELKDIIPIADEKKAYECIINDIYDKVSILNIMQGLSIDSTKKEPSVNLSAELSIMTSYTSKLYKILINDNNGKVKTRPNFFRYVGVGQNYEFKELDTPMDYLQNILDSKIPRQKSESQISLASLLCEVDLKKEDRRQLANIVNMIYEYDAVVRRIFTDVNNKNKYSDYLVEKLILSNKIKRLKINKSTMASLIKRMTFKTKQNKLLNGGLDSISLHILSSLYNYNKTMFLELFKNKATIKSFKMTKKEQKNTYYGLFFK